MIDITKLDALESMEILKQITVEHVSVHRDGAIYAHLHLNGANWASKVAYTKPLSALERHVLMINQYDFTKAVSVSPYHVPGTLTLNWKVKFEDGMELTTRFEDFHINALIEHFPQIKIEKE